MPRKKKAPIRKLHRSSRVDPADQGFYNPFDGLDQQVRAGSPPSIPKKAAIGESNGALAPIAAGSVPARATSVSAGDKPLDDNLLFREAMAGAGVAPLPETRRIRVPPAPPCRVSPRFRLWEEMDAYESLAQFVAGEGCFELSYSDEYVDGAIAGLSPKILKKLRNGDFSCQDHVDLHGCNVDRAYDVVVGFVRRSYGQGRRCVLIIPGRGLNSEGRMPVLKKNLVGWLTHAPLNRLVLAFTSARSYDGGVGALYVLMRRNPGKGRFVTPVV